MELLMVQACMEVVFTLSGERNEYCGRPAVEGARCPDHVRIERLAQTDSASGVRKIACNRCDKPVVDDGGFADCAACGNVELVPLGALQAA